MTHLREQRFPRRLAGDGSAGILTFLLVEYFDELIFTVLGVATPFLRDALALDYAQVGLLFGLPAILAAVLEPGLLLLGDTPLRGRLVLGGGLVLGLSFLLIAGADSFPALLLAVTASYPASGAFVGLTQATMIERHPARESEMMARWTAAGTLGSLSAPALFAGAIAIGLEWPSVFILLGAACLGLTLLVRARPTAHPRPLSRQLIAADLAANVQTTFRSGRLWRWVMLLPLADLMLDVFLGYIALFLTDVIGLPAATAAACVTVWLLGFLAGQFLLAHRLASSDVRRMIRWTSALTLIVFPIWLEASLAAAARLTLLFLLGLLASPWYPLLQGQAFAAAPGRAATVTALSSVTGTIGGVLAALVGAAAAAFGLAAGLSLLLLGPLALLIFTPTAVDDRQSGDGGERSSPAATTRS